MRAFKALFVSSVLLALVVLCLAGSAMAAITSAQSNYSVDPSDPTKVQVYSSYSQDPADQTISVSNFIMPRWDATCSQAGYPELENGGHPNGVIDGPDDATFNSNIYEHISNFTLNPIHQNTCIGTVAYTNSQVVVDAKPGYYNRPYFTPQSHQPAARSISISLDLNPNWLATTYYISYFKRVNTSDCSSPDLDDLATAQDTDPVEVATDLKQVHPVTVDITGLEVETDYCVSFRASNVAGNDDSQYSGYYTYGDPPDIGDASFTPAISGIKYDVDVTPNISTSDTILSIEYFLKDGSTCVEPSGGPSSRDVYYDNGGVGLRGFSPINLADTLDGLTAGASYCIRAYASSFYGNDDSATYQTVTTIDKAPATITSPEVSTTGDLDYPIKLEATFDDHGAYADTNNSSDYSYAIFKNTPDRCNEINYFGGEGTVGGSSSFSGTEDFAVTLADFDPGQAYCVAFHIDSAWGDAYDTDYYFAFYGGTGATVSDVTAAGDHTTVNVDAKIDPNYLETGWGVVYRALEAGETCDDAVHVNDTLWEFGGTLDMGLADPQNVSLALTGLIPSAHYCVQIGAENLVNGETSEWVAVDTGEALDTDPPSKPIGLSSTNVTQTSATLHWSASTDNVDVDHYKIYKNGSTLGTSATLSKDVSLICGTTDHFRVSAYDAQGNESTPSDEFNVTGAACDVPPPASGGGSINLPPAAKTCFAPVKSKTVTAKNGKKKLSIKLTFSVASDGQAIVMSTKVKGTTVTYKVNGKKVKPSSGTITIKNDDSLVTVSYKAGKKTRAIKIATPRVSC